MAITHAQTQQSHKDLGIGNDRIVVAANDTPAALKVIADYVCDGTADQSEINTALGVADSVYLMPGTYLVNASISLASNKNLVGAGRNSTTIKLANSSQGSGISLIINSDATNGNSHIRIAYLKIDENAANNTNFNVETDPIKFVKVKESIIEDVLVNNFRNGVSAGIGLAVYLSACERVTAKNCFFKDSYGIQVVNSSINCVIAENNFYEDFGGISIASDQNIISNNTLDAGTTGSSGGIYVTGNYSSIVGNAVRKMFNGGITLRMNASYNTVAGNICIDNAQGGEGDGNISVLGTLSPNYCKRNVVIGNICIGGGGFGICLAFNSINNVIKGNYVRGAYWEGIILDTNCHNNEIVGNYVIESSQETSNTYGNITLMNNCDDNNVQMNTCRQGDLTNKPAYGIRINTSDCNTNFVTNNDLKNGGQSANFSDAGTGTVTSAGNRTS